MIHRLQTFYITERELYLLYKIDKNIGIYNIQYFITCLTREKKVIHIVHKVYKVLIIIYNIVATKNYLCNNSSNIKYNNNNIGYCPYWSYCV